MKTVDDDVGWQLRELGGGPLDLGDAGKKGEHAALLPRQGLADRGGGRLLDRALATTDVVQRQRVATALAGNDRRIAEQRRDPGAIERRGHGDDPQIGPKRCLDVERQGQAEIAVEAALVNFIEQHGRDAGEFGIGLDTTKVDALGQHHDPGCRRRPAVHPRRIADQLADGLAGEHRHPLGGSPRCQAAWRQQQDLTAAPTGLKQRRGDGGGLAGAGRRNQHRIRRR